MFKSKKTVASILSVFETAKVDLSYLISEQTQEITDILDKVQILKEDAEEIAREKDKALNAYGALLSLTGQLAETQV